MVKAELTHDAERALIDIYLYGIERFGRPTAEQYAEALSAKITIAADNPSFGMNYDFVRAGLRRHEAASHAINYRITGEGAIVLRILHGRMDPARKIL